jgi:hypothetical protein
MIYKFRNFMKILKIYDPPTHGILTPYPWYIEPLSMVFCPPYPWYFDPPTHGILTPLPMVYQTLSYGRNEGGQFTMRGFKIQWRKSDPRVNISYENWPWGSKYHMTLVIRYNLVWGSLHLINREVVCEKHKLFQSRLCKYNLLKKFKYSLQFNFLQQNLMIPRL